MGYAGSYIWKLRQKIGSELLITATIDVLPIDDQGRIKLVYAKHVDSWNVVGGHVEPGDSYASAALNELQEEAGITASASDLIPWATISGPGRIFHYQDGDTQPFTLIFLIRKWQNETQPTDQEEIAQTEWFTVEEALKIKITPWTRKILLAYQDYLKTDQFQMIEVSTENQP